MKEHPASKAAYDLHTIPSRASWSNRKREFIGIITNLDSDLKSLEEFLNELDSPQFDFVGSCIEPERIGIRVFDKNTTLRFWIDECVNPDEIKKWLIWKWLPHISTNSPFSLNSDYTEKISSRVFRIIVPTYDAFIKIRYRKYIRNNLADS